MKRDLLPLRPTEASQPWPLGSQTRALGTHFSVYAPDATAVTVCLLDARGQREISRHGLPTCTQGVWHGHVHGVGPGQLYGLRASGPWDPAAGLRHNPNKLLLDPAAREVLARPEADGLMRDHDGHGNPDPRDNASCAWLAVTTEAPPRVCSSEHVRVPAAQTVLYEAHVRALTQRHPGLPAELRGTYLGLSHPAMLQHLKALGVTTLSLMPLMHWLDEPRLVQMGLRNHWGYNPAAWFAPEPRLSTGKTSASARTECREMIRQLHAAGFEVVMDVVLNHTAESDLEGPTLHLRGLSNRHSYHHAPHDAGQYENWAGCGNVVNLQDPWTLQLTLDALRHWVQHMGIDGFRFDLAPVLGRLGHQGFKANAPLLAALQQDPVLGPCRLIAEPWDIGPGGYQLGRFGAPWQEWNDRYRDTVRRFWLCGHTPRAALADVVAGSSALFASSGRSASASVNFITAHDGFTLRDLVSHEHKHNLANGEDNRDGHGNNHSWNCGVEGDTTDMQVLNRRGRLSRALMATLAVSVGTPMLLAGDELGHSQRGNNNAYCQDNDTTWIQWPLADPVMVRHTQAWLALRGRHGALCGPAWLAANQVQWLQSDGHALDETAWHCPQTRTLGLWLRAAGEPQLLLVFNAAHHDVAFALPAPETGRWRVVLNSAWPDADETDLNRQIQNTTVLASAHAVVAVQLEPTSTLGGALENNV
jgi:glycogen operon protein